MDLSGGVPNAVAVAGRRAVPLWRPSSLQLLAGIVFAAALVRIVGISSRPLWLDEAYSAWFSAQSWTALWTEVPRFEPHPPLYYSLLKLWQGLWGSGLAGLRGFSALFGVLAVPLVYAAAVQHERLSPSGRGRLRAFTAAALTALSPALVWLGGEARPYPLMIFAYCVAILALLKLAGEFRAGSQGSWSWWAALAGGTELILWSHALGLLYAACLFGATVLLASSNPQRGRWLRLAAASAAIGIAYLPCLAMLASRVGDWSNGWLKWSAAMPLQLIGLYSVSMQTVGLFVVGAAALMLLLVMRAICWSAKRIASSPVDSAMLLLWLGPPALAIAISATVIPLFWLRTLAPTLVPAYLAMASALARTGGRRERRLIAVALPIFLAGAALQTATRSPEEDWDKVSSYLATHAGPSDEIWLYPNDSALPLAQARDRLGQHYSWRALPAPFPALGTAGPVRAGSPAVVSLTAAQARELAERSASRPHTIWLVARQEELFDPDRSLSSALRSVRRAGPPTRWGYISVRPYYAAAAVQPR